MNYLYTGGQTLVFPSISFEGHTLKAVPGETYDLDTDPQDSRFVPSGSARVSSSTLETPDIAGEDPLLPPPDRQLLTKG